jgi:hypothetical protein
VSRPVQQQAEFDAERVSGPWHGVFLGAYATELEGTFYGYVKLFAEMPEDFWSSPVVMKLGAGGHQCHAAAIDAAERKGMAAVEEMQQRNFSGLWGWLVARANRHIWRG